MECIHPDMRRIYEIPCDTVRYIHSYHECMPPLTIFWSSFAWVAFNNKQHQEWEKRRIWFFERRRRFCPFSSGEGESSSKVARGVFYSSFPTIGCLLMLCSDEEIFESWNCSSSSLDSLLISLLLTSEFLGCCHWVLSSRIMMMRQALHRLTWVELQRLRVSLFSRLSPRFSCEKRSEEEEEGIQEQQLLSTHLIIIRRSRFSSFGAWTFRLVFSQIYHSSHPFCLCHWLPRYTYSTQLSSSLDIWYNQNILGWMIQYTTIPDLIFSFTSYTKQ